VRKGEKMNPVVVIGMHRSGTSLIVDILEKLGVFMGADQEHNKESLFFIDINKWILHQSQARWDNPDNYNYLSDEAKETLIPIISNRLKSYHRKRYWKNFNGQNSFSNIGFYWGWKDPRNTFTQDIWKKIFGELKLIHIYRNPVDIIGSLILRETINKPNINNPTRTGIKKKLFGLKLPDRKLFLQSFRCSTYSGCFSLWKEYVNRAMNYSEDTSKIIHISYEELISSPREIIKNISVFLSLPETAISTEKFIDPKRKFAFLENKELIDFYKTIKDDELVKSLNYGHIISNSQKQQNQVILG